MRRINFEVRLVGQGVFKTVEVESFLVAKFSTTVSIYVRTFTRTYYCKTSSTAVESVRINMEPFKAHAKRGVGEKSRPNEISLSFVSLGSYLLFNAF